MSKKGDEYASKTARWIIKTMFMFCGLLAVYAYALLKEEQMVLESERSIVREIGESYARVCRNEYEYLQIRQRLAQRAQNKLNIQRVLWFSVSSMEMEQVVLSAFEEMYRKRMKNKNQNAL